MLQLVERFLNNIADISACFVMPNNSFIFDRTLVLSRWSITEKLVMSAATHKTNWPYSRAVDAISVSAYPSIFFQGGC